MHIASSVNFVRSLASSANFTSTLPPGHAFVPAGAGDLRAPCPALNTLANHNYIPHSGKGIGSIELIESLKSMYHLSTTLATTLVSAGFLCCGTVLHGLDLNALAAHNKIEHDGSLVHDDADGAPFAPTAVDKALLSKLVTPYPNGLSVDNFAQASAERQKALKQPLDMIHAEILHGEIGLTMLLMQDASGIVPVEKLEQWYGEERFPDTYAIPAKEIGLGDARDASAKVGDALKKFQ